MSDKRVAVTVGAAVAVLYAARKPLHLERVDGGWLIEWKDTTHIPSEVARKQTQAYKNAMFGLRYGTPNMERYMGQKKYPYADGDTLVLGPGVFVSDDGMVINWKGKNYTPQENREERSLQDRAATQLVQRQITLTGEQKNTLDVLDAIGEASILSVEKERKLKANVEAVLTIQVAGGHSPVFTVRPDGVMRHVDEDMADCDEDDLDVRG